MNQDIKQMAISEAQIDKLAKFIMDEVPGEPSRDQNAVDTAIRLIREHLAQRPLVEQLTDETGQLLDVIDYTENLSPDILRHWGNVHTALAAFKPQAQPTEKPCPSMTRSYPPDHVGDGSGKVKQAKKEDIPNE